MADRVEAIRILLRSRERAFYGKAASMILAGAVLSLVGPAAVAALLWPIIELVGALYFPPLRGIGFSWLFSVFLLLMTPVLFVIELLQERDYLSQALSETAACGSVGAALRAGPAFDAQAVGTVAPDTQTMSWLNWVLLLGPRFVVHAARQLEVARHLRAADRRRAAEIVAILADEEAGVDTTSRFCELDELDEWVPALAYLTFHHWIGMRDHWAHVWLFSEARPKVRQAIEERAT